MSMRRWIDETGISWWEVSKEGADPVSLQGPGPCRGLISVPREEFEARFTKLPLPTGSPLLDDSARVVRLASHRAAKLLGLGYDYLAGIPVSSSSPHLDLVRIYLLLSKLVADKDSIRSWMQLHNSYFGDSPLNVVRSSEGLKRVASYLEVMSHGSDLLDLARGQENLDNGVFSGIVEHYKPSKELGIKK